jgi:hypothetical protein
MKVPIVIKLAMANGYRLLVVGDLLILLSSVAVCQGSDAYERLREKLTQQSGSAKGAIPVRWSRQLELRSLNDVDAALRGAFFDDASTFRAQPAAKSGVWVTVRNCQDYLDVDINASWDFELDPEISAVEERDIQATGLCCFTLQLLKNARPASRTFLADFRFTENVGDLIASRPWDGLTHGRISPTLSSPPSKVRAGAPAQVFCGAVQEV